MNLPARPSSVSRDGSLDIPAILHILLAFKITIPLTFGLQRQSTWKFPSMIGNTTSYYASDGSTEMQ